MRLHRVPRLSLRFPRCRGFTTSRAVRGERFLDEHGNPDYLRMILLSRVYGACSETPCEPAIRLSAKTGANVRFKREDLQPVFSFKLRGAHNMISQLSDEEKSKGVISASAGNHAQGVAYSAGRLGIPATIVMPTATPAIKYENVARLGATVVLYGDDFDAAKAECARLEKERGMTYIPPFDDPFVIAGQGTIAMEICRQIDVTNLRAVFCSVGGGGLVAGLAVYLKRVAPHVKVIGVETYDADAMYRSLEKGERVKLSEVGLFADGAAVKEVGVETFRLAKKYVDEVVHVNTDEICAAINDVFDDTRSVMEPAGAMSAAGMKKWLSQNPKAVEQAGPNGEFVSVISGANMNFDRLRFVSERSRLGAGKEVFFIVEMPEKSGSFKRLVDILLPREITEFSYRYNRTNPDARVYISFTVGNRTEINEIVKSISDAGMKAYDLSDNTLAKLHARYLVGGTPHLSDERVFRFEFPERPGALDRFLSIMQTEWNVSLFHYRNNGSDIGRVLTGIQIPPGKEDETQEFLKNVGYRYFEEDNNLAYQLCLK